LSHLSKVAFKIGKLYYLQQQLVIGENCKEAKLQQHLIAFWISFLGNVL
jgi:hypothetical protein